MFHYKRLRVVAMGTGWCRCCSTRNVAKSWKNQWRYTYNILYL